jgi:hypothetical protein
MSSNPGEEIRDEAKPPPPANIPPISAKQPASTTAVAALVISLAGFFLTFLNLYLTQLRVAPLKIFVGSDLNARCYESGAFDMFVPIALINNSARGGAILRARVLLTRTGDDKTFELEWFGLIQPEFELSGSESDISKVSPIAVGATSVVSQTIWFVWFASPSRTSPRVECILVPGQYTWRLVAWTKDASQPDTFVRRTFSIDEATAAKLRLPESGPERERYQQIRFDGAPQVNRVSRQAGN